jgi:hypothetical protein
MVDEYRTAKLSVGFLDKLGITLDESLDASIYRTLKFPKFTTISGLMEYLIAIHQAGDRKPFDILYDQYTTQGLDDYEAAQLIIKDILGLYFDPKDLADIVNNNSEKLQSIVTELSNQIKDGTVRDGITLLAWIRIYLLKEVLPRAKELYVREEQKRPRTAAQVKKEKLEEEEWQKILDAKPKDDSEEEPVPDEPMDEEPIVVTPEPTIEEEATNDQPEFEPISDPQIDADVEQPVTYPEEQSEDEEPEPKPTKNKRKSVSKNTKRKKQKRSYSDGGTLNIEDYIVVLKEIKIKNGEAVPELGYEEALRHSEHLNGKIVKSTSYDFGTRVWGAKVYPTLKFLKSGRKKLTADDVKHVGKFGVQELNMSDPTPYHIKDKVYKFVWKSGKRWLNLSPIVQAIREDRLPCGLQRNSPYIGPKGCILARDYKGVEIDRNGNKVFQVGLEEDDDTVLRRGTVGYDDLSIKKLTMIDTGARRNEISATIAKYLKLYNPTVRKELKVRPSGEIQTTTGVYRVNEVDLDYRIYTKDLMHSQLDTARLPPDTELSANLTFQFPDDPEQESNFDILLGRNGIRGLGIRIYMV